MRSEKIRDGESQVEKMQVREDVGKSRNTLFFPRWLQRVEK